MKALLIAGVAAAALSGCSAPQQQAARKADSALLTDTMSVLRPQKPTDKMPVIPMDTAKSDMPVVKPADNIKPK